MSLISKMFGRIIQIRIRGGINQQLTKNIYPGLNKATYLPTKAIVIKISSQGGTFTQAQNICDMIRNFKLLKKVKVYSFIEDHCLGVANLITSSSDYSYANSMSILGGFGFSWHNANFSKWNQKYGVKRQKLIANQAHPKYDHFYPLSQQVRSFTENQLQILTAQLKNRVLRIRRQKIKQLWKDQWGQSLKTKINEQIFGKPLVEPEDMVKFGMIDGIKNSWELLDGQFAKNKLFIIGKPSRIQVLTNGMQTYQGNSIKQTDETMEQFTGEKR